MAYKGDYLIHYGVKGMRWGVIRDKDSSKKSTSNRSKNNKPREELEARKKRAKKIVAISAGVTLAAVTAYVAYKHYDKLVDRLIPSGATIQNMNLADDLDLSRPFYAAYKKGDMKKYAGLYGKQLNDTSTVLGKGGVVNKTTFTVGDKPIKVASHENAKNVFLKTFSKKDAEDLKEVINDTIGFDYRYANKKAKINKALSEGKLDKDVYEMFNVSLVNKTDKGRSLQKRFYDSLRENGYGAIQDINDQKYSGYKANKPLIIFGGKDASVESSKKTIQMGYNEVKKHYDKEFNKMTVKAISPTLIAPFAAIPVVGVTNTVDNNAYVEQYLDKHPRSKLSYDEILKIRDA